MNPRRSAVAGAYKAMWATRSVWRVAALVWLRRRELPALALSIMRSSMPDARSLLRMAIYASLATAAWASSPITGIYGLILAAGFGLQVMNQILSQTLNRAIDQIYIRLAPHFGWRIDRDLEDL
jgi:hypothetical protein